MTDLEMTKLCAESAFPKIDRPIESRGKLFLCYHPIEEPLPLYVEYNPLHDDAQAMALVKRFGIATYQVDLGWKADIPELAEQHLASDLNRAIVECVAKMQAATKERA